MTVSSTLSKISYNGNGSTTAFATPYFLQNSHIVVILRDSDGDETTLSLTTHYTLSGAGDEDGGTCTMLTAPATGERLVIYRDPPLTQTVDYNDQDEFAAETANDSLDKHIMVDQRLYDLIRRSLRIKETDTIGSGTYQASQQRITDLGTATAPSDAVTLAQLTSLFQDAIDLIGFTSVPVEFPVLPSRAAAVALSTWDDGVSIFLTLGYSEADGNGAAFYRRTDAEPTGTTGPAKFQLGDGTWAKLIGLNGETNALMFGAVRDAVPTFDGTSGDFTGVTGTFNDDAILAYDQFIKDHVDEFRKVCFPAGNYAIYREADWGGNIEPLLDFTDTESGVTIDARGARFYVDTPNYDNATYTDTTPAAFGPIFRFTDCTDVTILGGEFIGDLQKVIVQTAAAPVGFTAIYLRGKCDNFSADGVSAFGMLQLGGTEVLNGYAYEIDPDESPIIEAAGSGYVTNDIVEFEYATALGSSAHAELTVTAVAGAVTAVTVTDPGLFEYEDFANALPTIDRNTAGFDTTTQTGVGTGLTIRPFIRVANPEDLPVGIKFDGSVERCCRIFTGGGAGLRQLSIRGRGNILQRGVLIQNDASNVELDLALRNTWLNVVDMLHTYTTPSNIHIRIVHEMDDADWINNSGTIVHDAQTAYPARFYNTSASVTKRWDSENPTDNGQYVWAPQCSSQSLSDLQERQHRIWGFSLHVALEGAPGNNGVLETPRVIGFADPGSGWPPYEAFNVRGLKVTGSLGKTAMVDLWSDGLGDQPDLSGVTAVTPTSQILVDGVFPGYHPVFDGVQFPATQNPSSNANTLDDYEEGSWPPVLTFTTPGDLSVAYSLQEGHYTKIGRLVTVNCRITTSTFTHGTASGEARITGLPFTSNATVPSYGSMQWGGITKASYTEVVPSTVQGTTQIRLNASGSAQALSAVTSGNLPTGGTVVLHFTMTYHV